MVFANTNGTYYFDTVYELTVIASSTYCNILVNGSLIFHNIDISTIKNGSIGLRTYYAAATGDAESQTLATESLDGIYMYADDVDIGVTDGDITDAGIGIGDSVIGDSLNLLEL